MGIASILSVILIAQSSFASDMSEAVPCLASPTVQEQKSTELQRLYKADQKDREEIEAHPEKPWTPEKMAEIGRRDLIRRKQVAQIFAEGCFKGPADFSAGALVFQHGTTAEHYLQAFIWSKRAVDLGDLKQKHLMALALDRYLVNTGQKQLFASQATKPEGEKCWCLQPVEDTFPDSIRLEYLGKSKAEKLKWLGTLNKDPACSVAECKMDLKPTPRGSMPGFW